MRRKPVYRKNDFAERLKISYILK